MRAIGIDSCEITRFTTWANYSQKKLSRIYSQEEINYCLQNKTLAPQRLAVRFAVREALFKALIHIDAHHTVPFLTLCKATTITKLNSAPHILIDWGLLHPYMSHKKTYNFICSFTHTKTIATAILQSVSI